MNEEHISYYSSTEAEAKAKSELLGDRIRNIVRGAGRIQNIGENLESACELLFDVKQRAEKESDLDALSKAEKLCDEFDWIADYIL